MAFSSIDYTEGKGELDYRGITLKYKDPKTNREKTKRFAIGDPVVDHFIYMRFISEQDDAWYAVNPSISGSSSWDHFFMDGATVNGKTVSEYHFEHDTFDFIDWFALSKSTEFSDHLKYKAICEGEYPTCWAYEGMTHLNDVIAYCKEKLGEK